MNRMKTYKEISALLCVVGVQPFYCTDPAPGFRIFPDYPGGFGDMLGVREEDGGQAAALISAAEAGETVPELLQKVQQLEERNREFLRSLGVSRLIEVGVAGGGTRTVRGW